jgi:hypothetical protein
MRPYLVLMVVALATVAAFGQQPMFHPGSCLYACGPFVPLVTTPEISLEQVSPNPVGASNATTGLVAGATNATLSEVSGSTDSVYTETVWIRGGGAPLTTPEVHLWPEPIGREAHPMHGAMHEEGTREEHARQEAHVAWKYYAGPGEEYTASPAGPAEAARGKGSRQAGHVYNNDDVTRQNDKNGTVQYRGKTEKI